jgi:tRNA-binding protein
MKSFTTISFDDFLKVEIISGTVTKVENNERAKKPAYKIWVDFGSEIGIKQTSAQVTAHYTIGSLVGMKVMGCLNLGTKNIAGFESQFLLLGFDDGNGGILLAMPHQVTPNGQKLH